MEMSFLVDEVPTVRTTGMTVRGPSLKADPAKAYQALAGARMLRRLAERATERLDAAARPWMRRERQGYAVERGHATHRRVSVQLPGGPVFATGFTRQRSGLSEGRHDSGNKDQGAVHRRSSRMAWQRWSRADHSPPPKTLGLVAA